MHRKMRKTAASLFLVFFIAFSPLSATAKNIAEDETNGRLVSHDQISSNDTKNEAKKIDLFSVGFIMLSMGTFFSAAASHWLFQKRKSLFELQSDLVTTYENETKSLKEYLDNANAIKNFDLSLIFTDLATKVEQLQQMEVSMKTDLQKIDHEKAVLLGNVSKAFESIVGRCL
jgi:hypothetical protein